MDASTETEPSSQPQPATDLHDDDAAEAASKPQETVSAVSATKKPASAGNSAMPLQRKSRVQKVTVSENKTYNIIVITEPRAKPFLGGWRHKTTGVEYVNASTQTPRAVRPNNKERYTRNTQTAIVRSEPKFATQTAVDTATQMTKDGVYITDSTDIVRLPGQYETADEREFRITQKVIILQKNFRRWHAKRTVAAIRQAKAVHDAWIREQEEKQRLQQELEDERELYRRMNPRTVEDFDLLYHSLEQWRQSEQAQIEKLPEAERRQARMALLKQECHYLSSIEQLKIIADEHNRESRIEKFLETAAAPRQWKNDAYDLKVAMETQSNQRAKELRDVYKLLKMTELSLDERLDALLQLKWLVEQHTTPLTKEILELIQREADLLTRGVKDRHLEGLRKRLLHTYLQFVEDPVFNPEAKRLMKVHQDVDYFRHNVIRDPGAATFHTVDEFNVSPQLAHTLTKTKMTERLENRAVQRLDNSGFRRMMDEARTTELKLSPGARCLFLMALSDFRYLVETIWGSCSALSEDSELKELRLIRWRPDQELTPWNCLLVTRAEAEAHAKLRDPQTEYGDALKTRVKQRHLRAKKHFTALQGHLHHISKSQDRNLSVSLTAKTVTTTKVA